MPTIQVGPASELELQQIADALGKSKKVVVITGAGISTNCGIPDFRSENGLYSMIQAQFDAALKNPPWEDSNTFDIDDRPKKKRRQWYYEVVAPDGKVVDVIDEELKPGKDETQRSSRSRGRPRSTNTTNSRSGSQQPVLPSLEASANQTSAIISEESQPSKDIRRSSRATSTNATTSRSSSPGSTEAPLSAQDQVLDPMEANPQQAEIESRPSSRSRNIDTASGSSTPRIFQKGQDEVNNGTDKSLQLENTNPCGSSRSSSVNRSLSRLTSPQPIAITTKETQDRAIEATEDDNQYTKEKARRSSRSRSTNTTNSRSSTPISTESSLTSLSSRTPELPETSFQDSSNLSLESDQSTLSQTSENIQSSTQASSGPTSFSRTTSSSSTAKTLPNIKGRDLFDSRIWASPFETSIFYMFISSLREKVQAVESTTETHRFLRVLRDGGKLVRNYTQNIDLLEQREGLCQDLEKGPGSKGRFNPRVQKEARQSGVGNDINQNGGCESVPLHGSLQRLRCNLCGKPSSWDEPEIREAMLSGSAPDCQRCTDHHDHRTSRGRRGLAIGRLRPDIVLYGEEHPHSNLISPIVTHDLNLGPDVLLIMGTSLRVHGLKVMIREFAKAVHTKGGKVVFVNQTKPSESIWGEFIDYWVEWDCDEWVMDLRDRREDIWTGVTEEKEKWKDSTVETKRWRPQALRDDKTCGVYLTFKILDTLAKVPDADGNSASRFPYWSSRPVRVSEVTVPEKKVPSKRKQSTGKRGPGRPKKSAPPPRKKPVATTKPKSNKRKAEPVEKNDVAYLVSKIWEDLRKKAPGLSAPPPELRLPYKKFKTSNVPNWYTPFAFDANSNYIPNVGGSPWPLEKMNLVTHPPFGSDIPIHTPKVKPKVVEEKPKIKHGYGTRASRRFSTAETIAADNLEGKGPDATIVVEDEEEPMTPASKRIKRSCSIGALVSSSPEQWHDAPEVMT